MKALSGQDPPPELVEVIYGETEGNAFFTEEVYKHLAEEGRLFDTAGKFRSDLTVNQLDVPEGVRLVVGARLQRLGVDALVTLTGGAVIGRVFSVELLCRLEELGEDAVLDLLEQDQRSGLIIELPGERFQFMFTHRLIRQTVLGQLSASRRARLHARVAETLEHFHAGRLEPHAAAIAHHLIEAGPATDPKRTFGYLLMAGTWAVQAAAFEEALVHLERTLERSPVLRPPGSSGCGHPIECSSIQL